MFRVVVGSDVTGRFRTYYDAAEAANELRASGYPAVVLYRCGGQWYGVNSGACGCGRRHW